MPAQLSACLTQAGEAQTRLRQRGYWPHLELQLLEALGERVRSGVLARELGVLARRS